MGRGRQEWGKRCARAERAKDVRERVRVREEGRSQEGGKRSAGAGSGKGEYDMGTASVLSLTVLYVICHCERLQGARQSLVTRLLRPKGSRLAMTAKAMLFMGHFSR